MLKQVGLFKQALHDGQLRVIDGCLAKRDRFCRPARDPSGQGIDKVTHFLYRRKNAVEVAPGLARLRIDIITAEANLHGPTTPYEPREPLRARASRQNAQRNLHLVDHGFSFNPKPHVARRREFITPAARTTCHFDDRCLGHGPHTLAHLMKGRQLSRLLGWTIGWESQNEGNIEMRNEKVGISTLEDHHFDRVIHLEGLGDCNEVLIEFRCHHIHRGIADGDMTHASIMRKG